jgi:hypothetical protein
MKIHVVELFDPLGIEYCTFWFYSVVEKARHLFITHIPSLKDQNSLHLKAEEYEMYRQVYTKSECRSEGRSL